MIAWLLGLAWAVLIAVADFRTLLFADEVFRSYCSNSPVFRHLRWDIGHQSTIVGTGSSQTVSPVLLSLPLAS